MRRDGSHFFTTSYSPPRKPLSLHRSLSETIATFCSLILSTSLSLSFSPRMSFSFHPSFPLYMKSICPFIIWLVLFFDRSISKANTGVCVVSHVAQMGRRCFCSRYAPESHFLSLFACSLMLTGSTPREEKLPDRNTKHAFLSCIS